MALELPYGRWLTLLPGGRTLDAPLVSPGEATPFPNPDRAPDLRRGLHSLLGNNIWGTNYGACMPAPPSVHARSPTSACRGLNLRCPAARQRDVCSPAGLPEGMAR